MAKKTVLWKVLALGLISFLAFGNPAVAADEPIEIGFIVPLSGGTAYWGQKALQGIEMAIDEINGAGGILGKQIKLKYEDTGGEKSQAVMMTNKLLQEKVAVLLGPPISGTMLATGPIAQRAKVPFVSAGATNPKVGFVGNYVFKNALDDSKGSPLLAGYMLKKTNAKKVALMYSNNNDYAVGLNKLWKKAIDAHGAKIAGEVSFSDGDNDFSAQVTKLKSLDPDLVFFSGYASEAGLILRQAKKMGFDKTFVSGDAIYDDVLFKLAGDAADGTVIYTGYSAGNQEENSRAFIENFKNRYGEAPQINNAIGYDTMHLVARAIAQAGSLEPSKIRDAIAATTDFPGVSGNTSFTPDNGNASKPAFIEVVKDGKFQLLEVVK